MTGLSWEVVSPGRKVDYWVREQDLPDGFENRHDEWPAEVSLHYLPPPLISLVIVARPPSHVSRLFLLSDASTPQNSGRVCFLDEKEGDQCGAAADEHDPVDPAPPQILVYEPADNGTWWGAVLAGSLMGGPC